MRNPPSSPSKRPTPCCTKVGLKRGPWTPEEDEILSSFVRREGEGRWRTLPKRAGLLRCGKSCRLRWMNYLRPSIKHGRITPDEEDLILRLHRLLGNRWSLIAGRIPGRTDNEIKNYWNTHLSKKLISQGIDPRTHKPLNISDHNPNPNHNPNSNPNPCRNPSLLPNPNPSPMPSVPREMDVSGRGVMLHNNHNDYFGGTSFENHQGMKLHGGFDRREEEDDDDMDCCNDDVFSSFLDSLINDDMFLQHEHHQQEQQQNVNSSEERDSDNQVDPMLLPSAPDFGNIGSSIWDASVSSPIAVDEVVNGHFIDQTGRQV